mmetsp:Transcript_14140/g.41624  ORF Transcript_14140/g.41624 Transcript_14140/m.41624 type:complete len:212 (-) Transcript_14140:259-894(-)
MDLVQVPGTRSGRVDAGEVLEVVVVLGTRHALALGGGHVLHEENGIEELVPVVLAQLAELTADIKPAQLRRKGLELHVPHPALARHLHRVIPRRREHCLYCDAYTGLAEPCSVVISRGNLAAQGDEPGAGKRTLLQSLVQPCSHWRAVPHGVGLEGQGRGHAWLHQPLLIHGQVVFPRLWQALGKIRRRQVQVQMELVPSSELLLHLGSCA